MNQLPVSERRETHDERMNLWQHQYRNYERNNSWECESNRSVAKSLSHNPCLKQGLEIDLVHVDDAPSTDQGQVSTTPGRAHYGSLVSPWPRSSFLSQQLLLLIFRSLPLPCNFLSASGRWNDQVASTPDPQVWLGTSWLTKLLK